MFEDHMFDFSALPKLSIFKVSVSQLCKDSAGEIGCFKNQYALKSAFTYIYIKQVNAKVRVIRTEASEAEVTEMRTEFSYQAVKRASPD
jgi:hypothetical protein